jgi:metallo-beta-lactamase class B
VNKVFIILFALAVGCLPGSAQVPPASTAAAISTNTSIPVSQDPVAARNLFDSWKKPMPPRQIIGNIYYVGSTGVSSWLITTASGHVLIDTTFEECVPQITRNIEQLGFRVSDIKFLLSSHAHVDHTGGHALMKQRTGARIVASAADAHVLETGGADDFSPFPKELLAYTPVKADRIVQDGDVVSLGDVALTAHLTPGHTKGATTWTMTVQERGKEYHVVFFSSVSIAAPTSLRRNAQYPGIAEDYEATFKKLHALPCDIFLAPHADQFGLAEKLRRLDRGATQNPFIDPEGWRRLIGNAERSYRQQLAAEQGSLRP